MKSGQTASQNNKRQATVRHELYRRLGTNPSTTSTCVVSCRATRACLCSGTNLSPPKTRWRRWTRLCRPLARFALRQARRKYFGIPRHLERRADDGDVGDDPNEEVSEEVDAEPFSDDESIAHHDSADEGEEDK